LTYFGYKFPYKKFDNLLARDYCCGSACPIFQEQAKRYIIEQEEKDVFEYDIYGCPKELKGQMKIGDFTSKKTFIYYQIKFYIICLKRRVYPIR